MGDAKGWQGFIQNDLTDSVKSGILGSYLDVREIQLLTGEITGESRGSGTADRCGLFNTRALRQPL